jgi:hypothetical protein
VVWLTLKSGIITVNVAFAQLIEWIVRSLTWVAEKFDKIPLPKRWSEWSKGMTAGMKDFGVEIGKIKDTSLKDLEETSKKLDTAFQNLMSGKEGNAAKWFNGMKAQITDFQKKWGIVKGLFAGLGKEGGRSAEGSPTKTFFQGWEEGMKTVYKSLTDFGALGKKVAEDTANSMKTSFSSFFYDAFTGQLKKGKDYFRAFGQSILKIWSDTLAQMVTASMVKGMGGGGGGNIFGSILGLFGMFKGFFGGGGGSPGVSNIANNSYATAELPPLGGFSYHRGGVIRAHGGLAVDEVPIIAQTGERVLSRAQNRRYEAGGGGGLTININPVVQLWDTSDLVRNQKTFTSIITMAITNNAQIRKIIKEYA